MRTLRRAGRRGGALFTGREAGRDPFVEEVLVVRARSGMRRRRSRWGRIGGRGGGALGGRLFLRGARAAARVRRGQDREERGPQLLRLEPAPDAPFPDQGDGARLLRDDESDG